MSSESNLNISSKPKFDTLFFERYAKITLETLLGDKFANLVNSDRPDLQDNFSMLGIEVTRAMRESKTDAFMMINEMAVDEILEVPDYSLKELAGFGYCYGLTNSAMVGSIEYNYWINACSMTEIIAAKIAKLQNNLYGDFKEFGLYIFTKDDIDVTDIISVMKYTISLQQNGSKRFSTLYVSEINMLYVCNLDSFSYEQYVISEDLCRKFFFMAINR